VTECFAVYVDDNNCCHVMNHLGTWTNKRNEMEFAQ
jgi:hypothetical protein